MARNKSGGGLRGGVGSKCDPNILYENQRTSTFIKSFIRNSRGEKRQGLIVYNPI